MVRPLSILGLVSAIGLLPWPAAGETVIHHQLQVSLTPQAGQILVHDTITMPGPQTPLRFSLHPGLTPTSPDPGVRIEADPKAAADGAVYRVTLPPGSRRFTVNYQGKLTHPLETSVAGIGRDQQATLGFISADGVYLDANSQWYPRFGDELVSFTLTAATPPGWQTISQGKNTAKSQESPVWEETHPQEEIYLLAAPYHEYHRAADGIDTAVLLRSADPALAKQYLSAIAEYVAMYSRLLGPYPYGKFDVVENSWESGYGMPSFTLLGPQVMRLPFILHSSLPHEILHNWWGNGVYVDYSQGNWSEGLTAYLADHLLREQAGQGAAYRRNALLRYANYVSEGNDFPLKDFLGRHGEASQAVGYDKALMLFHMLRLQLGDRGFITALRNFYQAQRFHRAGWADLRHAFEAVAHHSLQAEFQQWLTRRGAPALQLSEAHTRREGDHYLLSAEIAQTQPGPVYRLSVPVAVQLQGQDQAWQTTIDLSQKQQTIQLTLPARPWRLQLDPEFDVFRRLDPGELPPTLSEAFGADRLLMVLPSAAPAPQRAAYQGLVQTWAEGGGIEVRWDKDLTQLPADRAVWLLGWENRFRDQVAAGVGAQLNLSADTVQLGGQTLHRENQAVVLSARQNGAMLVWLGCDNPAAVAGLARKLPHYGSYSYLAFEGDAPTNILKGQWRVLDSPLNVVVRQADHATAPAANMQLRPRPALTDAVNAQRPLTERHSLPLRTRGVTRHSSS